MNKVVMLTAVGALGLSVSGCGLISMPVAAAKVTEAQVSSETLAKIQNWCLVGSPLVRMGANFTTNSTVGEIAAFVQGYCGQLNAGTVPPTTDNNTVSWLERNVTRLRELLRV